MTRIHDVFTETEQLLIAEALRELRATKQAALSTVRDAKLMPGGRQFEERDIGIPQIDRLLKKLEA